MLQQKSFTVFEHVQWMQAVLSSYYLLLFFFRMLAQSYTRNIHTPTPIPLFYNPFTIVLHKRLSAYPFRMTRRSRRHITSLTVLSTYSCQLEIELIGVYVTQFSSLWPS